MCTNKPRDGLVYRAVHSRTNTIGSRSSTETNGVDGGVQGLRLWSFLHSSSGSPGFRFGRPQVGVRRPPGLQGAPGAAERPNLGQGRGCAVMITAKASADSAVPSVHGTAVATGVPEREEPEWPWKDAPIRALVQRIHQLQAERAQAFRRLEEGHLQYLRSGPPYDFPRYRSTVHEVTQAFAAASREVLAVEAELSGPRGQPLLASHVRSLQQLEQTRLATVALLQLMGTPELTGQEDTLETHQLKMKVIKTMEAISEVLQDLRFDAESAE
ncbi:required for excision 1-B domain-containing protein isoform X2 [Felis catus]|uniref:required for excision 1-B domain-containing protein isoform X2 n=1 Tax=Felis catus TaxID=9685 RepID=UPI0003F1A01C|nr:required for excision 1-B domain-containing protein isoform X2 [Felis catus]